MAHRKVREVMTTDVTAVAEGTTFKDLAGLVTGRGAGALPVLDPDGRVTGVVCELDLLRKQEYQEDPGARRPPRHRRRRNRGRPAGLTAKDMMTSPALTVAADATIVEAARSLDRHQVRRLLVPGPDGRVAGIVSAHDLLKVYLRSDDDIRGEVTSEVLTRYLGANPGLVDVTVADGVVTLRGEVEKKTMTPLAVQMTRAVDGVVHAVNRLTYAINDTHMPLTSPTTSSRKILARAACARLPMAQGQCLVVHRGSVTRQSASQAASRRRCSLRQAISPAPARSNPSTAGASSAVRPAWPITCSCRSGGPVNRPEASAHTSTVLPALAPAGAETLPLRCAPLRAVHLARTWGSYPACL
jgi:CBS domain-containing protein